MSESRLDSIGILFKIIAESQGSAGQPDMAAVFKAFQQQIVAPLSAGQVFALMGTQSPQYSATVDAVRALALSVAQVHSHAYEAIASIGAMYGQDKPIQELETIA
jgi:hypothetical protein